MIGLHYFKDRSGSLGLEHVKWFVHDMQLVSGDPGAEVRAPGLCSELCPQRRRLFMMFMLRQSLNYLNMLNRIFPPGQSQGECRGPPGRVKPAHYKGTGPALAGQDQVPKCRHCPAPTRRLAGVRAGASICPLEL